MTSTAEITIEKPDFNKTKQPPGLAWKVSALTIVVGVGFLVSVAVASIALGLVLKQQSDIDGLNARVAILEGRDTVKLTTDAVAPPGFQSVSLFNGEWAPGVQMPEERSDHQAVFCSGKIIILGGLNITGEAVATTWEFDPIIETFATGKAAMPTARYRFGATCLEGRVYVAGGYPTKAAGDAGQCLSTVDVYDVATDTWSAAPPLSLARGDLALAVAEGTIFAMGGYGYEYPYPDPANEANEAYSPASGTWMTMMPLPGGGKGDISAAEIDGVIYVPGGWNGVFKDELAAYNASADEWIGGLASMGRARGDKAVATLEGHLYVVGGEIWSGKTEPCPWDPSTTCNINGLPIHACELYSPTSDSWTSFAPVPTALFRFAAAAANGIIFAFGGQGHGQIAVNTVSMFLHERRPDVYLHVQQPSVA